MSNIDYKFELGEDQWKWLKKYDKINLKEWRYDVIDDSKFDWFYVGNWKPTEIQPYPSNKDGEYEERHKNLKKNRYHYWPS